MSIMNSHIPKIATQDHRIYIIFTALISLTLRWFLVFQGGQYFFSDEQRYEKSRVTMELILDGHPKSALTILFTSPEHIGYKWLGLVPAFIEKITRQHLIIPALFFSLFSVINLYLIYLLAKRAGASPTESLYALLISASSMSLLYYSRHLMPYDTAMTFGLAALYVGLSNKPTLNTSIVCGGLSFLCFITYNGYWTLSGLAVLAHLLMNNTSMRGLAKKVLATASGYILPAAILGTLAAWVNTNLIDEASTFATTINQGSFDEGWSLPFEYFWHTEHLIFIMLIVLSLFAIFNRNGNKKTVLLWAGAALFIYVCLLVFSVFLHSFVVYGRLARQTIPFLILLAASGLNGLEQTFPSGQKLARIVLAIIIIQFFWNYKSSFNLSYPREFAQKAQTLHPEFDFSEKRLAFGAPTLCQDDGFILEYVKHFAVPPEANPPVRGQILLASPHPDIFLPYQYEGFNFDQRQALRDLYPVMKLLKADEAFMSDANPIWKKMKSCTVKED